MAEPLVTLFATKEKFFKNSKRILVLHEKNVVSYENGDQVKFKLAYREIQGLGPAPKPNQFILKTPQMAETYIADSLDAKEAALGFLNEFRKKVSRKGEENNIDLLQMKAYTEEVISVTTVFSNVFIAKMDGDRVYSQKYLKDIERIATIEEEQDAFVIIFADRSKTYYKIQGGVVSSVIDYAKKLLTKHYGRTLTISQAKMAEVMPPADELPPAQRLFGFPIKKYSKRLDATENRVLCMTAENLYVCDGATVLSVHALHSIRLVSIFEEDRTKFQISYSKSTKTRCSLFYCDERDVILANLMNICGSDGPVFDFSGTQRSYYIPDSCLPTPDADMEDHFVRKLSQVGLQSPDLAATLKEFLVYIPASYSVQSKDRRALVHMFELLQQLNLQFEKANKDDVVSVLIDVLSVIQRLLSSRVNYTELRNIKNAAQTFSDLLRSREDRIVAATAQTILRAMELPKSFTAKETKAEAANKAYFLSTEDKTSPVLNALLSTLIQRAGESVSDLDRKSTLSISCLLDILVSQMDGRASTTDRAWFREVAPKMSRGRVVITLFELARSSCFAIALKTTTVLKVIFTQIEDDRLVGIQDTARQQLSLLFQIFQAVNSRLKSQRKESAELVGLMTENNDESMKLVARIFPPGLIRVLHDAPAEKKEPSRRRLLPRAAPQSRTKLNWQGLFKAISADARSPQLLWNAETRNEVVKEISNEIERYEREKENNQETNKIWNHEEFAVEYETLKRELIVSNCYLGVILEQPDQLQLKHPASFLYQCFHRLMMEDSPEDRVRYLNVMSWCYRNNYDSIGEISCFPNLVQLLQTYITHKQHGPAGALLEFFLSSFKMPANVRQFINMSGVATAAGLLTETFVADTGDQTIVCLNVLLSACRHVNSTDERGCIKIPIPRSKRELSTAGSLSQLVKTLLHSSDLVVEYAARLLTEVLDKNSLKAKGLHKHTGVLYCLFSYQNTSAGPALMRLLQVLAQQQDPHLIRKFIPDTVATYLQEVDAEEFANVFYCQGSSPEVIWNNRMLEILQGVALARTADLTSRLASDPHASYEHSEIDTIEYPGLDQELRCGNYYIRNVIENPEWNIENVEEVLRDALEMVATVERANQVLLLRACSVLFKKKRYRKKATIKSFEGFPVVLRLMALDRDRPDLSAENIELLNAAAELIFYSVWTSDENLTKFLKLKGLSSLCNLLWCCSRHAQTCYSILAFVLKIVCRLLPSPITRDQVALNIDIIRDILSCLTVGQPAEIVTLAMQCLIELSQEDRLADAVFKNGGHYYLLDFVLSFNPQADPESDASRLNQLAVSACLVLGNISGIYKAEHEKLTAVEAKLQAALTVLLTKGNVTRMREQSEFLFVGGLCEAYESPESIWNESTRNELAAYIRSRIQAHQHSQQVEPEELQMVYAAHAQELQVDGVFLRYYVQTPHWRLANARSFVTKLLADIPNHTGHTERLTLLLQSLYCVLTETQGQEKLIVSSGALDQFFAILASSQGELQSLILSIFLHATANQACVDAICATDRLPELVAFLRSGALEQRRILLEVVSNMVSCSSRAVEGITTSGLILYLLQYVLNAEDEQLCAQALGVLKQTKASSGLDTRFVDAASLFLPGYLVALLDRPANFLHFLQKDYVSPNIIWNGANRSHVQSAVTAALNAFQASGSREWSPAAVAPIDFAALNNQLLVGGVYVDIYLQAPQSKLHNAGLFIDTVFEALSSTMTQDELSCKLIECLCNLLTHNSAWAHYVAKVTPAALQTLLGYFENPAMPETLHRSLLKVVIILVHVPACRKKFHQTMVISQLLKAAEKFPAFEELVARTVYLLVKKEAAFVKQVLDTPGGMAQILRTADKRNLEASRYAIALLKSMVADRKYDGQVRKMLAGREQILAEKMQLPMPEWVSVAQLTPAMQALYIEPFEADVKSQQLASMQRMASSASIPSLQAAASASGNAAPAAKPTIAPLARASTMSAMVPPPEATPSTPTPVQQATPMSPSPAPTGIPLQKAQSTMTLPAAPAAAPPPIPNAPAPSVTPFDGAPPPAPSVANLPPPPMAAPPSAPPPASSGRNALLDSIVKGKALKKVDMEVVAEERKTQAAAPAAGGGGGDLMNALAGALAARRTALITDLAANPFADDDGDDEGSEEWD